MLLMMAELRIWKKVSYLIQNKEGLIHMQKMRVKLLSSQPSGNKSVKWNDIELHPSSSKIMSNPRKVWQLGGFPKENGKLNTEKNNMQFVWKKDTISNKSRDLKASFETSS